MACNGYNHPKDCRCNFRGGHPNSRPPVWQRWRKSSARRYISGPNARCPECRTAIFYVPGPKGGGAFYDSFGPPWPKHACTDKSRAYSPYGRSGKPKLKVLPSEFESAGWIPFFIRNIERLPMGSIMHGVAINNPTVLHFGSLDPELAPDEERPVYFRSALNLPNTVEVNYFPVDSTAPLTASLFSDCRNELELLLHAKQNGSY